MSDTPTLTPQRETFLITLLQIAASGYAKADVAHSFISSGPDDQFDKEEYALNVYCFDYEEWRGLNTYRVFYEYEVLPGPTKALPLRLREQLREAYRLCDSSMVTTQAAMALVDVIMWNEVIHLFDR